MTIETKIGHEDQRVTSARGAGEALRVWTPPLSPLPIFTTPETRTAPFPQTPLSGTRMEGSRGQTNKKGERVIESHQGGSWWASRRTSLICTSGSCEGWKGVRSPGAVQTLQSASRAAASPYSTWCSRGPRAEAVLPGSIYLWQSLYLQ